MEIFKHQFDKKISTVFPSSLSISFIAVETGIADDGGIGGLSPVSGTKQGRNGQGSPLNLSHTGHSYLVEVSVSSISPSGFVTPLSSNSTIRLLLFIIGTATTVVTLPTNTIAIMAIVIGSMF